MKYRQSAQVSVNGAKPRSLNLDNLQKVGRVPVPRKGSRKVVVVCYELMQAAIANSFKAVRESAAKLVVVDMDMPQAAHIVLGGPPLLR